MRSSQVGLRVWAVVLFLAISAVAWAQTKVGDTKDGCDASRVVSFTVKGGKKFSVKAGEKGKEADLPFPVQELEWFCGGDQEFSSNDVPYDRVRVDRKENGAITFTFLRLPPPEGGKTSTAKMGDTADGCDKKENLTFQGRDGKVTVGASQTVIADLPAVTNEINAQCGGDDLRAANDNPFDQVRVSRNINGAIQWTFYLKTAAADPPSVCNKIHATGRLLFKDENGDSLPLKNVRVKLMDEDFGPTDSKMAEGITNDDGRFDLTGSSSDSGCIGAGCRRPDPYVEFILFQKHRVDVKDPLENTARRQTETQVNKCGDIDFGDQTWSGAELDAILFNRAQLAYDNFSALTKESRVPGNEGLVGVEYPTVFIGNTAYTTWDTIHWPYLWDKMLNFATLDHEFGHRIRHAADGDRKHFNWDATRFVYARHHGPKDVTNEGFAFNEGWGYYHKSLLHPDVNVPNGTWTSPTGDDVEGDVANQLLKLSNDCGGFPRLWHTMKDAGHDAFHSIDEFRVEFMKRNPTCGVPPTPVPTRSIKGALPGGPLVTVIPVVTPTPSIKKPAPGITAVGRTVLTPTPSIKKPFPGGPIAGESPKMTPEELARLGAEQRRKLQEHFDRIEKRETAAREKARLRIPSDIPAASRPAIERLSTRHSALAQTFHSEAVGAYRKAFEGLASLTRESLSDGSYETARQAAKDAFAERVFAARLRHLQEAQREIAAERKKATNPRLRAYLSKLARKYARDEDDLERAKQARKPGSSVPSRFLPKSFVATTASK